MPSTYITRFSRSRVGKGQIRNQFQCLMLYFISIAINGFRHFLRENEKIAVCIVTSPIMGHLHFRVLQYISHQATLPLARNFSNITRFRVISIGFNKIFFVPYSSLVGMMGHLFFNNGLWVSEQHAGKLQKHLYCVLWHLILAFLIWNWKKKDNSGNGSRNRVGTFSNSVFQVANLK